MTTVKMLETRTIRSQQRAKGELVSELTSVQAQYLVARKEAVIVQAETETEAEVKAEAEVKTTTKTAKKQ